MSNSRKYTWLLGFTGLFGIGGISGPPAFLLGFGGFAFFGAYWWYKMREADERLRSNVRAAGSVVLPRCLVAMLLASIATSCLSTDPWMLYRAQLLVFACGFAVAGIAWPCLAYRYDR